MNESLKKFLIDMAVGLVLVLAMCWILGLFSAQTTSETLRILCDAFFVAAVLLLAGGGLTWTYNGGVADGLGYTFKNGIARMRREYEVERKTFAEYREEREAKASSPKYMLLSGLCYLVIAVILYQIYSNV